MGQSDESESESDEGSDIEMISQDVYESLERGGNTGRTTTAPATMNEMGCDIDMDA